MGDLIVAVAMASGSKGPLLAPENRQQSRGVTWPDPGSSMRFYGWGLLQGTGLQPPVLQGCPDIGPHLAHGATLPITLAGLWGVPPHLLVMAGWRHMALELLLCWGTRTA